MTDGISDSRRGATGGAGPQARVAHVGVALHVAAGVAFAVAQPLFDLLARHPTFLVAHGLDGVELRGVALALCPGLPLAVGIGVAAGVAALARIHPLLARAALALVLALLLGAVALPWLGASSLPAALQAAAAGAFGAGAALAHARSRRVRGFATALAVALVAFPIHFLTRPAIAQVAEPPEAAAPAALTVARPAPLVLVVFDALALWALVDAEGRIDARRHPHFAALAARSHWFREATTVADKTKAALPALLTGRYPLDDGPPSHATHPENLFTWLSASHDLNVFEPVTRLCPPDLCERPFGSRGERLRVLARDLRLVYLHRLLPAAWASGLPAVDRTWRDFGGDLVVRPGELRGRGRLDIDWLFERFLRRLRPTRRPGLHFVHLQAPHWPYQYLPSGRSYAPFGRHTTPQYGDPGRFADPDFAEAAALQPYLLQVGYCDTLLGRLVERLEAQGLFDDALLVVTSDHGVSFRPDRHPRLLEADSVDDILPVPLLVKLPGQRAGHVHDRNVELVDLAPGLLDALGAALPPGRAAAIDGRAFLDPDVPARARKTAFTHRVEGIGRFEIELPFPSWRAGAARLRRLFDLDRPDPLFAFGPHADLVGRPAAALPRAGGSRFLVRLEQPDAFARVDPASGFVPAFVAGALIAPRRTGVPLDLAIGVNGRLRAVTRSFAPWGADARPAAFETLVPESALRPGANDVSVWVVETGADGERRLHAARPRGGVGGYRALRGDDGALAAIATAAGRVLPALPGAVPGRVERTAEAYRAYTGAESVLMFAGGRFVAELAPVAPRAAAPRDAEAGPAFRAPIPYARLRDVGPGQVRFVGVAAGLASELAHQAGEGAGVAAAARDPGVGAAAWPGEATATGPERGTTLERAAAGLALRDAGGPVVPVRARPPAGVVERWAPRGDEVVLHGAWQGEAAAGLLLFAGDRLLGSVATRPEPGAGAGPGAGRFRAVLPAAPAAEPGLRLFAPLAAGGVAELRYAEGVAAARR